MRHPQPTPDLQQRRLAHELGTPLGVGTMAASLLPAQLDTLMAELDAPTQQRLSNLVKECQETAALLQSSLQLCVRILGASAQATPAQSATPGDMATLPLINLQATLQTAVSVALARRPDLQVNVHMQFANELKVHGDSAAWQQVFGNLVANSLLHGFDGRRHGSIQITATRLPGKHILVHYYDDGIGLSDEAYTRLFDEGFSTRLGAGGHGLGMGITRDLVHNKMGGRIHVHRPAKGVHISIEAPC